MIYEKCSNWKEIYLLFEKSTPQTWIWQDLFTLHNTHKAIKRLTLFFLRDLSLRKERKVVWKYSEFLLETPVCNFWIRPMSAFEEILYICINIYFRISFRGDKIVLCFYDILFLNVTIDSKNKNIGHGRSSSSIIGKILQTDGFISNSYE